MNIYHLLIPNRLKVINSSGTTPIKLLLLSALLYFSLNAQAEKQPIPENDSICINAIRTENFELAKQLCEKQLRIAQLENDQASELSLHIALADTFKQLGDDEAFSRHLNYAENHPLFESSADDKYQWLRLKAIKLHHDGQFKQSNQLFSQALKIAIDLHDELKTSNSNIDLGISAAAMGNFKTALNHYRTSLELTRQMNDPYATGLSLKSVGNVYMKLEEFQDAIRYYEEALAEYTQYTQQKFYDSRVHGRINAVYESLVDVHQQLNNKAAAKYYQQQIEQFAAQTSNNHDQANQLESQAKQLIETADYNQAVTKLTVTLKLYQSQGIQQPVRILNLLAQTYQHLDQNELAIHYALEGTKNTESSSPHTSKNYQILSQLYAESDPQLALNYAHKYNQSREAFLATKYNTDLKTIQHQIELEKNQNKLVSSQLKNTQQQVKIQTLTNKYLVSLLLLLCLAALIVYLYIKKKREQSELQATINYHKNQFAVLSLSTQLQQPTHDNTSQQKIKQEVVNQQLVAIMHDATNLWVTHTGENLIELADRSKIWTITNDNGTLRARSLEKYLSLQKMPQNPRWRNVVRTCHFVLSEAGLGAEQRQSLNLKLESLMQIIKDHYGTGK